MKKELEAEKKKLQNQLKGYEISLSKLNEERDKVSHTISLSLDEKNIQYDLIDRNLGILNDKITSIINRLSDINKMYTELGG